METQLLQYVFKSEYQEISASGSVDIPRSVLSEFVLVISDLSASVSYSLQWSVELHWRCSFCFYFVTNQILLIVQSFFTLCHTSDVHVWVWMCCVCASVHVYGGTICFSMCVWVYVYAHYTQYVSFKDRKPWLK